MAFAGIIKNNDEKSWIRIQAKAGSGSRQKPDPDPGKSRIRKSVV
jgi:hypothetical protein